MKQHARPSQQPHEPRYTIITAVYNVSKYLGDFIKSINGQTASLANLEVIAVDDGSTDDSLDLLNAWQLDRPDLVRVVSQKNQGQGAARNLGLEYATGTWVTFVDPDDWIAPDYFDKVDRFLAKHSDVDMVATSRLMYFEVDESIRDSHPLRQMFAGNDRVVDLDSEYEYFHGSAPAGFFKLNIVKQSRILFDERIRPNFEDGHFCAAYLLSCPTKRVAYLSSAKYYYRKRADGTSTLQNSLLHPGRYTDVPRYGYLDLLERSTETQQTAPRWLQTLIIYELSHYFKAEEAHSGATAAHGKVAEEFRPLLRQIASYLEPAMIGSYRTNSFLTTWREVLSHAIKDETWHSPYAVVQQYDSTKRRVLVAFRFTGDEPEFHYIVGGLRVEPVYSKVRTRYYFSYPLLHERVAWLDLSGSLQVFVADQPVELSVAWRRSGQQMWFQREVIARAAGRRWPQPTRQRTPRLSVVARIVRKAKATRARLGKSATLRLADSRLVRRWFGQAWVLLDRLHDADDSGQRLFEFLRSERPEVNAWFVLERNSADWERVKLVAGRRLIPYDTLRWRLLMLNCKNLISSHIDAPVHNPPAIARLRKPNWNFVFLQHGVIKDDLSRWLNAKRLRLFVTSTTAEQDSIVGDYTPYAFTRREAILTGLPRFDRLRRLAREVPPERQKWVIVCPTWRNWLFPPLKPGSQHRELYDGFEETEFALNWFGFLRSRELLAAVQQAGLHLGFLPHPNLSEALDLNTLERLGIPPEVRVLDFHTTDIQPLLAETRLFVTDYSSMVFNGAYINRSVVYFQFDSQLVTAGAHVGRSGYFKYERDGFGPVTYDLESAIATTTGLIRSGAELQEPYLSRIAATFPNRDGQCCARVADAVQAL